MKYLKILKERWKFYLPIYLLTYIVSLYKTGIPNIAYLIPIKFSAFLFMILLGNAAYHAYNKSPSYYMPIKCIKYLMFLIPLGIIMSVLRFQLMKIGIDISPILGFI